ARALAQSSPCRPSAWLGWPALPADCSAKAEAQSASAASGAALSLSESWFGSVMRCGGFLEFGLGMGQNVQHPQGVLAVESAIGAFHDGHVAGMGGDGRGYVDRQDVI